MLFLLSRSRSTTIPVFLSFLLVGSCIFGVGSASETEHAPYLRRDSGSKEGSPISVVGDDDPDIKEMYITQQLDHFDRTNEATYQQRYFVDYSRHGSKQSGSQETLPIISLLCVGGEGPGFDESVLIDSVHCSGDMLELAKRIAQTKSHRVHLYALEHRYYGKSYPAFVDSKTGNKTSPLTVQNLRFLSSHQALEDLAHFVHTMNKETSTDGDPSANTWVTFGGSYPGLMSMYARYKYPHLVFASVSSSAPLQLRVDFPGYKAKQGWGLKYDKVGGSEECHRIVQAGHEQAVAVLHQPGNKTNATEAGPVVLAKKFGVCDPGKALSMRRNQELLLGDGLVVIPSQGNDPKCTGGELCNIAGLCRFMIQETEKMRNATAHNSTGKSNIELEVLAKVSQQQRSERTRGNEKTYKHNKRQQMMQRMRLPRRLAGGGDNDDCVDVDFEGMVKYYSDLEVRPFGDRSWLWQTCTEFGFYQTCGDDCPYAAHFHQVDMDLEICARLFNISSDRVYENVQSSLDAYGGKSFLESGATSRILTVNGNVDPWSALGLEENDSTSFLLPVKMVDGASHHFWTHAVKDTDALEIIKIREYIYSCVMSWLGITVPHNPLLSLHASNVAR